MNYLEKLLNNLPPRSSTWADALDNSALSLEIDLLRWRMRWSAGTGGEFDCELLYLYCDFGPIHIKLAIGH